MNDFTPVMQVSDIAVGWMGCGMIRELPVDSGMPFRSVAQRQFEAEAMPHMNDLFRTATGVLGEASRAEDVVQEVYLQAWKSFDRFEPGTNCRAWLFKILFHCINHHRRKWFRFPLLKQTEEFLEANLTCIPSIPEHLTDEDILAALDKLPADFSRVVSLVDVQEFSYKTPPIFWPCPSAR